MLDFLTRIDRCEAPKERSVPLLGVFSCWSSDDGVVSDRRLETADPVIDIRLIHNAVCLVLVRHDGTCSRGESFREKQAKIQRVCKQIEHATQDHRNEDCAYEPGWSQLSGAFRLRPIPTLARAQDDRCYRSCKIWKRVRCVLVKEQAATTTVLAFSNCCLSSMTCHALKSGPANALCCRSRSLLRAGCLFTATKLPHDACVYGDSFRKTSLRSWSSC